MIEAFKDRWFGDQRLSIRAEAEVDEVPDQTEFVVKNMATVALQLLKRYRNVRYANYSGRIPPSFMLSYFGGAAALPDMKLSDMLIRICRWIHVYDRDGDPRLCLCDPAADEWDATMHLSRTIVPWSADWLACYELWLMTGRWTGGGRHPIPRAAGVAL
ncbi:hypothetical protein NGR_b19970 (plasmid) [Sinorhizobium fredii NGR234]|uniref:Type II CBASS E2 protein domain-containing protein n=1 Tax=Sinorhizobium fredii (strain NBRC 101917 / NGR234) TaxID=394 RepID=C3KM08_SINFN|nr:hypothetical protein [Sinorhizobium fredii]ACP23444.1 hypothetical protein NGR_b19970 [Sinorhizobium fredii NGR234]